MNPVARHGLTVLTLLIGLVGVAGLGILVVKFPMQTFWTAVAAIATTFALSVIAVAYRFIYRALEDVKISRS